MRLAVESLESRTNPSGLNLSAMPASVTLGSPISVMGSVTTTQPMSSLNVLYSWADQSSDTDPYSFPSGGLMTPISHSHTYLSTGNYTIQVTANATYTDGTLDSAVGYYPVTIVSGGGGGGGGGTGGLPDVRVDAIFHTGESPTAPAGQFDLIRLGGDMSQPLTVSYLVAGSATPGVDYNSISNTGPNTGSVTFAPYATTATITVTSLDDALPEDNETVIVTIDSNPSLYHLLTPAGMDTCAIADDEGGFAVLFDTKLIPVNANNDNWTSDSGRPQRKSASQPYVPFKRDFEWSNFSVDDPQLVRVFLGLAANTGAGTLSVTAFPSSAGGQVSFWSDKRKINAFQSVHIAAGLQPPPVYVEGNHESIALDDVNGEFTFTPDADPTAKITRPFTLTVTPVINSFTATIPNPSVSFRNRSDPPNGLKGMIAQKYTGVVGAPGIPGITLVAGVVNGDLPISYVQEFRDLINGANDGGPSITLVNPANKLNFAIKASADAQFPLLDTSPGRTDPLYSLATSVPVPGQPPSVLVSMTDSPNFFYVDEAQNERVSKIDLKRTFRAYLVVRYSDGSIYSVANYNWDVNFLATDRVAGKGVTVLSDNSRVSADAAFNRSNTDPDRTATPLANEAIELVDAP